MSRPMSGNRSKPWRMRKRSPRKRGPQRTKGRSLRGRANPRKLALKNRLPGVKKSALQGEKITPKPSAPQGEKITLLSIYRPGVRQHDRGQPHLALAPEAGGRRPGSDGRVQARLRVKRQFLQLCLHERLLGCGASAGRPA